MFEQITNHVTLYGLRCHVCAENNCSVTFSDELLADGELDEQKVLILKPDLYYHSSKILNPPKSPDCLILIRCAENEQYNLYLIELKDVSNTKNLKHKDIRLKFETMINLFFKEFKEIFEARNYKNIYFYLVSTYPKNASLLSPEQYKIKIKGSALATYDSMKLMELFGKLIPIQVVPSPFYITTC